MLDVRTIPSTIIGVPSLFIDGTWTAGSGGTADVLNPFDASVVEQVDQAGPDDVERAVAAARAARSAGFANAEALLREAEAKARQA